LQESQPAPAIDRPCDTSIIVACLNSEDTIRETFDSLVIQESDRPWEIVVADNGSTDGTRAVVRAAIERYPGIAIRLVDASQRKGKSHGLNAAIRAARGRYVMFCDADDTVAPDYVATMSAALDAHPLVASRIDIDQHNPPWARTERNHPQTLGLSNVEHAPFCLHAGGATLGFHKEVFEAVGDFDPDFTVFEDTDFCVRAHLKGFEIRFVPEAVYHYRFRDTPHAIYAQAKSYARFRALLRSRYAGETRSRFAPMPWLAGLDEVMRLSLIGLGRRIVRRPASPLKQARSSRRLGRAVGDLAGALEFRVAPPARPQRVGLLRRLSDRVLRPAFGSLVAVRTTERVMALTFDDGPDPASTPVLLDMLASHGMKATFFLIGSRAAAHPELVARIVAEGHAIGNHTWDHPALSSLGPREIDSQLRRGRDALAPHGATLMRPPYGAMNFWGHLLVRLRRYRVVTWSINGADWRDDDAETLARRILAAAQPGKIVLLHDTLFSYEEERFRDRSPTIEAVGILARSLPGYRFVTVPELLRRGRPAQRVALTAPSDDYLASLKVAPAS
jgi:peptidoglycan/xylan/chitin deacetylase (PgdA/CDA1 family)/glycosyltransferase involved in cell wall biosynthesis